MKTSAGNLPALFAAVLVAGSTAAFAQNIASSSGTVSRNTDHLTLLPGPGLLSPARGAGVPPPISNAAPGTFRFVPATAVRGKSPAHPTLVRPTGILTLSSSPAVTTGLKGVPSPKPETLEFNAKLETVPASLQLRTPVPIRRD